jgi:ribosome-binding factor A
MSLRSDKAASQLVTLAAKYIAEEAGRTTLITPTRANISPDRKNATIFFSVFPTEEGEHALAFLTRHRDDFRESLKKARFGVLPFVKFELDYGELNRQRLDDISRENHLGAFAERVEPEAAPTTIYKDSTPEA